MLDTLYKLFTEQLKLAPDYWLYIFVGIVALSFIVALVAGLTSGRLVKVKSVMKAAVSKPETHVAAMKKMPVAIKAQYKNARLGNLKPSMLVTEQMCVDEPYKRSLISKVWLVTFVATAVCAALCYVVMPFAYVDGEDVSAISSVVANPYLATMFVLIAGGFLTLVGAIVGKCVYTGAAKTYSKFVPVIDGDQKPVQDQAYSEPRQNYAEPQQAYEPQQEYAEPVAQVYEPQQDYAEPQQAYAQQQAPVYESQPVMAEQQESEEETRRRAREEALAQARAQQAAAASARQQQQSEAPQQQQSAPAHTSADDVIARIEQIDRDGAPRETMREVATLLQKERVKPENKTPEQQRKLNEALSKLLKAMSAASKK